MVRFARADANGFNFVEGELNKWIRLIQSNHDYRGMPPSLSRELVLCY